MGGIELFNMIFSTLFGSIVTLWKNAQEDKKTEREFYLKTIAEQRSETKDVREYQGVPITEQSRIKSKVKKWILFGKEFGYNFSLNDSGTRQVSTGFHLTRRFLAIVCILAIVVFPIVVPAFWDGIMFTYGYVENSWSILPWVKEVPVIKWITVGAGDNSITLTPLSANIAIMILSLFFGNQLVKRQ